MLILLLFFSFDAIIFMTDALSFHSVRARKRGWAMSENTSYYETLVRLVTGSPVAIAKNCITALHAAPFRNESAVLPRSFDNMKWKFGIPAITIYRLTLILITRNNLLCHTMQSLWIHEVLWSQNHFAGRTGVRV